MYDQLFPAAKVRLDVASLLRQIKSTLADAEHHRRQGALCYCKLGELLLQARQTLGSGCWEQFVRDEVKVHPGTARRWIRLAKVSHKSSAALDLDEAWKHICGHYDAEEQVTEVRETPSELIYFRPCRIGVPKPNCPTCLALREEKAKKAARSHDPATNASEAAQEEDCEASRPAARRRRRRARAAALVGQHG